MGRLHRLLHAKEKIMKLPARAQFAPFGFTAFMLLAALQPAESHAQRAFGGGFSPGGFAGGNFGGSRYSVNAGGIYSYPGYYSPYGYGGYGYGNYGSNYPYTYSFQRFPYQTYSAQGYPYLTYRPAPYQRYTGPYTSGYRGNYSNYSQADASRAAAQQARRAVSEARRNEAFLGVYLDKQYPDAAIVQTVFADTAAAKM